MHTITFHNTELHLQEHPQHEFLLSNKEVALGYGTTIQSLAQAKKNNKNELIEGKHWLRLEVQTKGGKQKVIHWTKKGIVRLGFFIKSENAKKFRDWAEDYIVNGTNQNKLYGRIGGLETANARYRLHLEELMQRIFVLENRQKRFTSKKDCVLSYKPFGRNSLLEFIGAVQRSQQDMEEMLSTMLGHHSEINKMIKGFLDIYPEVNPHSRSRGYAGEFINVKSIS